MQPYAMLLTCNENIMKKYSVCEIYHIKELMVKW